MPYIRQDLRGRVDPLIGGLVKEIRLEQDVDRDGYLNYVVTCLVARTLRPQRGWRYHYVARALAVFHAAAAEFYRRVGAEYEDGCRATHGDIEPYDE